MPLRWSPTSEIEDVGVIDLTGVGNLRIQFEALADERNRRDAIAENREDDPRILVASTKDDVPLFVMRGFREVFDRIGLRTVDSDGDVLIGGALRRFFVTERDTYEGEVSLMVTLKSPSGALLWEGIVSGSATRWGRSYSADNYCETLSDSTFDAAAHFLQSSAFVAALRSARPTPAGSAQQ